MDKVKNVLSLEALSGFCEMVSAKLEEYFKKGDDLVLDRVVSLANHLPIFVTLKRLTDEAGMSVSIDPIGIDTAPGAFVGLQGDLEIPLWCYNIWAVAIILQLCSATRSALADKDELTQADITSTAITNLSIMFMIGSENPLHYTVIAALLSCYSLRKKFGADLTIHTACIQLVSAFTTTVATLGVVSAAVSSVPILQDATGLGLVLNVVAMHAITNRAENGTVKEIVNGGILAGMAVNALKEGMSLALELNSIISNFTLAFLLYVAVQAVDNARRAVFDL